MGATHEYLSSTEPFELERLDAWSVTHHADGGSRGEKFERDLELLERQYLPRDIPFVHTWVYEWGMRLERSIALAHSAKRDEALWLTDGLLARDDLPDDVKSALHLNRQWDWDADQLDRRVVDRRLERTLLLSLLAGGDRGGVDQCA